MDDPEERLAEAVALDAAREQEDRSSGVPARLADALQTVSADRDRLRKVVQGSLIAIETILMGDHVDLGEGSGVILGRVSAALKRALEEGEGDR